MNAKAGPKTTTENITPTKAKRWLASNTKCNRPVSPRHVEYIANEIKAGRWQFTGDAIRFDDAGNLLDGQHRLHAVVATGATVPSVVVRGLPSEVFTLIDTNNRIRTLADNLAIVGNAESARLAAALTLLRHIEVGRNSRRESHEVMLGYAADHPDLPASVRAWGRSSGKVAAIRKLITPSAAMVAHYLTAKIDEDDAAWFIEALFVGENLPQRHPVFALRSQLIREMSEETRAHARWRQYALYVLAWNAHRKGRTPRRYKWASGDAFPVPR